jgi:sulfotransferase family protein
MSSLRKAVPLPLQRLGRRAYVRAGALTASLRVEPDFVMVGASRCGTTSLFRSLMDHPSVVRPSFHKGVNYFDLNHYRGPAWYLGHFPTRAAAQLKVGRGVAPVTFEASGYYIFHPLAIERMAAELPRTRLVVMLRDPVERAYSAYQHEFSRGFETEPFERALDLEEERLAGEVERIRHDPTYESTAHRHHAYLRRGEYAGQLATVFAHFPRGQVHVMDSEAFFARPEDEFAALADFLGLPSSDRITFKRYNAEPRKGMSVRLQDRLERHYAPHNEQLIDLLGRTPAWLSRTHH